MPVFVSLGSDCTSASLLREFGLRNKGYPFDWLMSLVNINEDFESDFSTFFNDNSALKFTFHGKPGQHRVDRLKDLLQSKSEKVYFIRNAHQIVNHGQIDSLTDEKEIQDMKRLNDFLKEKYEGLDFEIILFLTCTSCHTKFNCQDEVYDKLTVISATNDVTLDIPSIYDEMRKHLSKFIQ
jgi:hypothetical protein